METFLLYSKVNRINRSTPQKERKVNAPAERVWAIITETSTGWNDITN